MAAGERLTKGVFTHHTEAALAEMKSAGGLVGLRGKATLQKLNLLGPGSTITLWQTQPDDVRPSSEYGVPPDFQYPNNLHIFEIARPAPAEITPPQRFLDVQAQEGRQWQRDDLRQLPMDRWRANIHQNAKLKAALYAYGKNINEKAVTREILQALQDTEVELAAGQTKEAVGQTLGQLVTEREIAHTITAIEEVLDQASARGLRLSSPIPDKFPRPFRAQDRRRPVTRIGHLLLEDNHRFTTAQVKSPYLKRYKKLAEANIRQRIQQIGW